MESYNNFFAKLYHKHDIHNKNKVKLKNVKNGIATFYFKPRNDMLKYLFGRGQGDLFTDFQMENNPYVAKADIYKNSENVGGPRILWSIEDNTYTYVVPSNINFCGCTLDDAFRLYYTHPKNIPITDEYLEIKKKIKTYKDKTNELINGTS